MSDRHEQAGSHAEARTQTWTTPHSDYADGYVSGHMAGVEWADANRTIAFSEVERVCTDVVPADQYHVTEVLEALGIEVEDSDEAYRVHAGGS